MGWIAAKDGDKPAGKLSKQVVLICLFLLFASAINYMDRQTLASVATRITTELRLTEKQYGAVEASFGWGFALGSLVFGFLVDSLPIRFMYPMAILLWSAVGFLTGYVRGYDDLLICRGLLGFFEAAHWPCGLKTTQALLTSRGRGLGNSVLQSGTSIGAFATPLLMLWLLTPTPGSWRIGFQAIGAAGVVWIAAWFALVRDSDLRSKGNLEPVLGKPRAWWREVFCWKLFVLLLVLLAINTTWQILRAWLPKVLQQQIGYSETETLVFTSAWYLVTDIGCIGAGAMAFALASRGWSIKGSRTATVAVCSLACALVACVPWIPKGPLLLAVLLVAGAGALGLFPMYYAFSQDISTSHQGKVTGITGILAWAFSGVAQMAFGSSADATQSFSTGLIVVGLLPLFATLSLVFFWPGDRHESNVESP